MHASKAAKRGQHADRMGCRITQPETSQPYTVTSGAPEADTRVPMSCQRITALNRLRVVAQRQRVAANRQAKGLLNDVNTQRCGGIASSVIVVAAHQGERQLRVLRPPVGQRPLCAGCVGLGRVQKIPQKNQLPRAGL